MKKAFLFFAVITLLLSLAISVSAAEDYHVYSPVDLEGNVTVSGGLSITNSTLVDGDKVFLRVEANKTGASSNSQTVITIDTAKLAPDVKASEYPIMKISYRSNIAANAQITANIGVDYTYNGEVKGAKFFTKYIYFDRTDATSSFKYNYKECTSGEIVTPAFDRISGFSTSNVPNTSIYNFIYLKPYVSNLNMVKGEHFDIEYVGFFKTAEDADEYVHGVKLDETPLTELTLREQVMRITKGDTHKLNIISKPSFVPLGTNFTYTSSDESIATVDTNGVVTAKKAGTVTITVKSGDLSTSCKFFVLNTDVAPLPLYEAGKAGNNPKIIVNSIGDSITTYVPNPEGGKQYHYYWAQWYNITNNNYGVSSTTVNPRSGKTDSFLERYSSMRGDADLITVKGGTNDWATAFATGTLNDREATTFMGGIRLLMEGLIEKYPDKQIVFFTPIRRCESKQTETTTNGKGATLRDYADAIIELGKVYGIPVIDLYAPKELDFTSAQISPPGKDENGKWHDAVCESDLMPDGLHPSGKGQKIMAEYMMEEMLRLGVFRDPNAKVYGDMDGDGMVSSLDWVLVTRAIANWSGYSASVSEADFDSNGKIDSLDSLILARHLANWKGYKTIPLN